ncbi:MAG: hypothetical protein RI897_3576 [Verrucomicrobiota bacterium]
MVFELRRVRQVVLIFVRLIGGDVEVIEVGMAAGRLGGVVKEAEAVAHEVGESVAHFELGADGVPVLSVEAVGEAGGIGAVLEVAFGFEVDGVLVEGDAGGFGG